MYYTKTQVINGRGINAMKENNKLDSLIALAGELLPDCFEILIELAKAVACEPAQSVCPLPHPKNQQ